MKTSLKGLLKSQKLTQQEVAGKFGVHQTLVSQWCTGRTMPTTSILPKLAELLGISTDDLISVLESEKEKRNEQRMMRRASQFTCWRGGSSMNMKKKEREH